MNTTATVPELPEPFAYMAKPLTLGKDEKPLFVMHSNGFDFCGTYGDIKSEGKPAFEVKKLFTEDQLLASLSAAQQAEPIVWSYCPECGCDEWETSIDAKGQICAHCSQEWFPDIDYTDVVQKKLSKLHGTKLHTAQPAQPTEWTHDAAKLAEGIHNAAVHAGIIKDGTSLTGPQCLMLLDNLARMAAQPTVPAELTEDQRLIWSECIDKAVKKLAQYWRSDSGCAEGLREIKAHLLASPAQPSQPTPAEPTPQAINRAWNAFWERKHTREAFTDVVRSLFNTSTPPAHPADVSKAAQDVFAERQRQMAIEGWTPEHDDEHSDGSLVMAAICYAMPEDKREPFRPQDVVDGRTYRPYAVPIWWPESWCATWWKPKNPRRDLVRAAALLLAEIERLDRAALANRDREKA